MGAAIITIKKESIERFFAENCGGRDNDVFKGASCGSNLFSLMKDDLIIRKSENFHPGDNVEFIIDSKSPDGKFEIEHRYQYEVMGYDDLSYKLHLMDFVVRRRICDGL